MREIKFRAWDKVGKSMYDLGHLADIAYTTEFEHDWSNDLRRYELMQYTGLKDKNGDKEIYEGDIVKVVTNHIADLAPKHPETTSIVEVKFEDAMFRFGDMTMDYFPLREAKLEVIGNIYENPELVE